MDLDKGDRGLPLCLVLTGEVDVGVATSIMQRLVDCDLPVSLGAKL